MDRLIKDNGWLGKALGILQLCVYILLVLGALFVVPAMSTLYWQLSEQNRLQEERMNQQDARMALISSRLVAMEAQDAKIEATRAELATIRERQLRVIAKLGLVP